MAKSPTTNPRAGSVATDGLAAESSPAEHLSALSLPPGAPFDLGDTLKCGQLFHWEPLSIDGVEGVAGCIGEAPPSWIAQRESGEVLTLRGDEARVGRYFGLDQDLAAIHASFPQGDAVLAEATAYCPGIRIARQPLWECLATFITSSLKQVAHIRGISLTMRRRFGEAHELGGCHFHGYPSPERVASLGETALRQCGMGYRAVSLARAAERIASGEIDPAWIETAPPDEARETLLSLHGVGEKIANCVLLFSCGHWDAFPIDVWIERILRERYRKRIQGTKLQAWAQRHFGPNAGYAQQYLFHYARKAGPSLAKPPRRPARVLPHRGKGNSGNSGNSGGTGRG